MNLMGGDYRITFALIKLKKSIYMSNTDKKYQSPECEILYIDLKKELLVNSIEKWGEEDLFEDE